MLSFAIIGAGALGGYYGARLAQAGYEVHLLCHRDGPFIREKGLVVESQGRSVLHVPARAYDRVEDMPPCDIALVALKTTSNQALPHLLPPALKPDGAVLVMQNGWDVEVDAAAAAPGHPVVGGLCFLCANKVGPGVVRHLDYGDVMLGRHEPTDTNGRASAALAVVADALQQARIPTQISENLRLARWKKLVWNIPYNGLSVVHLTTTDVLMADPRLRAEVETLMREVQALARADGHGIEDAFIQKMLDDTLRMTPYKTSMFLDYEAGRPMELEVLYERPLLAGERAGASAPHIRALWETLVAMEKAARVPLSR
ncbi:MAG TPA: 2-dehydropantoate 2-reductase [Kiritimatiellia bacterium]|nr:2-dehydropantoate 2-reductase [Kiritimatiellia bacterium]HMP00640.1 2-dehydropantoate 2-reductase [Kiritimatiellia bacterium]HMP97987.1 2-dehydropantoate 2-reductase [Kiritimatiellia bacterium]